MTKSQGKQPEPEFYVADEVLIVSGEGWSLAYRPGDQVPPEHVERFGWQAQVSNPGPSPKQDTAQEE